jgi:D-alanine--poly(phosphoribitol) ligase subunit 2
MEKLDRILNDIHPEIDFENEDQLVSRGILVSFDIVTLIGEINDNYNIEIGVEHICPENFNSMRAIMNLITRLQKQPKS